MVVMLLLLVANGILIYKHARIRISRKKAQWKKRENVVSGVIVSEICPSVSCSPTMFALSSTESLNCPLFSRNGEKLRWLEERERERLNRVLHARVKAYARQQHSVLYIHRIFELIWLWGDSDSHP